MHLRIDQLTVDPRLQMREEMDPGHVADLVEAIKAGSPIPAVVAFREGKVYWLADGWHRRHAHIDAGRRTIDVDVRQGSFRAALLYAVGCNRRHGLRRTNGDKRRSVMALLTDPEWGEWPNREIAERAGVSEHLVRLMRAQRGDDLARAATKSQLSDSVAPESVTSFDRPAQLAKAVKRLQAALRQLDGLDDCQDARETILGLLQLLDRRRAA